MMYTNTRFLKVIRDLTSDYPKNFMLVLAIAIGVFGMGSILGGYTVLDREMKSNYGGTNPASATLELDTSISTELLDSVRAFPGIKIAERHATLIARMQVGHRWYPLLLFVIDDFEGKQTNKAYHVSGEFSPADGCMLVERTAFVVMGAKEGDAITIKTPHGEPKSVRLTGTVHDPGLAPAWQEQAGYGYVTLSTLHSLGESRGFDQLRILVEDDALSSEAITRKAEALATWLEAKEHKVHEIQIPPPGKHPHQGQMNAVLSIFTIFSFLILLLGSILVGSSMATLMVKQVRQIGVMKTVGAHSAQISGMYLLMILLICAIALVLSIPLSRLAATAFYDQIAVLLNLEIKDTSIPWWVLFAQIGCGTIIPLLAAAIPVVRGSRISVRAALDNFGVNLKTQGKQFQTKWFISSFGSESFKLSLRNVFRQRSRLVMTLGLLAAGGAMFMTALNVSEAWNKNLSGIYQQRLYDLEVKLLVETDGDLFMGKINSIPGVTSAEGWYLVSASIAREAAKHEITHTYPDKGHGSFSMLGLPVPTSLLKPTVTEGHWLNNDEGNGVVLNQLSRSGYAMGDSIRLSVQGKITRWKIIGFTEDLGSPAIAYVSMDDMAAQLGTEGKVNIIRIGYADRSRDNANGMNSKVEALLQKEDVAVTSTTPVWRLYNAIAAHMKVLVNSLLAMAILMAVVGTLGLMSTMSMNVLERTREIGVMRAIGATPKKIKGIVIFEGLIIGTFSVMIAFVLSLILSYFLGRFIGQMSFRTPLPLTFSFMAFLLWIVIIVAGSFVATLLPARRANRITTREALAYE